MRYRRMRVAGGTYFFNVVTHDRGDDLLIRHVEHLRRAVATVRRERPFAITAAVVLPDHLHMIWRLPPDDADFSTRWSLIKACFSRAVPTDPSDGRGYRGKRERCLWQRRYWEHLIRDDDDLARHVDYVHYNPVKHGLVPTPAAWPHSSLHRYTRRGLVAPDWASGVNAESGDYGE
jgi:putative transposase